MQLYSWTSEGEARIVGKNHDEHLNLVLSKISDNVPNVSSLVLLSIILYQKIYMKLHIFLENLFNQYTFQAKAPIILKERTTKNLLICLLWVLKNVEKSVLKQWWTELPTHRLLTLLEILRMTISCFQYKVRNIIKYCTFRFLVKMTLYPQFPYNNI